MQSLQYCNLRVKDAICDRLRDREGARPDVDTVRPDAKVHLFLDATSATLYLDTSGESLFKRGWRYHKGAAPLRENLRSEEHTSELQSRGHLVCRLLLEQNNH